MKSMINKLKWMFLFIGCYQLNAQQIIKGKIQDEMNNTIPFVSVGFVGTSIGTVADINGIFLLNLNQPLRENIPLRFSCVGFEPIELIITNTDSIIVRDIELKQATIGLEEVVVRSETVAIKTNGNHSENTAIKTNLALSKQPNMNLGAEVGRKFRLSNKRHLITGLKFFMAYNNYDTLMLRINFYETNMNKPTRALNGKSIIRQVTGVKSGWVNFDLTEENILLSGTVVASVEWVGASKRGNAFGLNISMPAPAQTHYYKYGAQNTWKVFPGMSTSMVLTSEIWD